jgi:hypothetical protein
MSNAADHDEAGGEGAFAWTAERVLRVMQSDHDTYRALASVGVSDEAATRACRAYDSAEPTGHQHVIGSGIVYHSELEAIAAELNRDASESGPVPADAAGLN